MTQSAIPNTIGAKYIEETEELKDEMRKLFKKRTVSMWLHITADLMMEELKGIPRTTGNHKRIMELVAEVANLRKLAYETHFSRK